LYIEKLKSGETVSFRPRGSSMTGLVNDGQLCTVKPADQYCSGDIVLCEVGNKQYLHLIKDVDYGGISPQCNTYLIGNNKGGINGRINVSSIYGKLIEVKD